MPSISSSVKSIFSSNARAEKKLRKQNSQSNIQANTNAQGQQRPPNSQGFAPQPQQYGGRPAQQGPYGQPMYAQTQQALPQHPIRQGYVPQYPQGPQPQPAMYGMSQQPNYAPQHSQRPQPQPAMHGMAHQPNYAPQGLQPQQSRPQQMYQPVQQGQPQRPAYAPQQYQGAVPGQPAPQRVHTQPNAYVPTPQYQTQNGRHNSAPANPGMAGYTQPGVQPMQAPTARPVAAGQPPLPPRPNGQFAQASQSRPVPQRPAAPFVQPQASFAQHPQGLGHGSNFNYVQSQQPNRLRPQASAPNLHQHRPVQTSVPPVPPIPAAYQQSNMQKPQIYPGQPQYGRPQPMAQNAAPVAQASSSRPPVLTSSPESISPRTQLTWDEKAGAYSVTTAPANPPPMTTTPNSQNQPPAAPMSRAEANVRFMANQSQGRTNSADTTSSSPKVASGVTYHSAEDVEKAVAGVINGEHEMSIFAQSAFEDAMKNAGLADDAASSSAPPAKQLSSDEVQQRLKAAGVLDKVSPEKLADAKTARDVKRLILEHGA